VNLVLKSLKIKNFMRIKDAFIEFPLEGVFGILAQGKDDPDRSNFIGKTTTIEAIRYNLTGLSRASKETSLIHHNTDSMLTELVLLDLDSNAEYTIKRGRAISGEGLLEYSDSKLIGEKSEQAKNYLEQLLGMTPDDFDLTIFFKQSEINQFMNLGPSDKKKMLMNWQNNEHWIEKEKAVLRDLKDKKDELKMIRLMIDNLNNDVGSLENLQQRYAKSSIDLKLLQKEVNQLEVEFDKIKSIQKITESEALNAKRKYDNCVEEYKKITDHLNSLSNIEDKINEIEVVDSSELYEKQKAIISKLPMLEKSLDEKTKLFQKLIELNTGLCPILSESCDRIKLSDSDRLSKEKEIKDLKNSVLSFKQKYERISLEIKTNESNKDKRQLLQNKLNKKSELEQLQLSLKTQAQTFKEIYLKYDATAASKEKELASNLTTKKGELQSLSNQVAVLDEKIRVVEQNEKKADELRNKLQALSEQVDDLAYVAYMFGKNGIPSLEIENSFQEIEDEINYILSQLVDISLEFKPDRELKAWEEYCLSCGFKYPKNYKKANCSECNEPRRRKRKDELALNVIENGNESDFDMCSGGLKTLISLAVRTALTQLRKRQNKSNLNILFLDEIDSALDKTNKTHVVSLINNVLHKKLGFKQIFWISHDKNISHNVPYTLLVKGYDTYSKVGWL
jgi:DNA repair exonuclease SbcCD ATPase subunit